MKSNLFRFLGAASGFACSQGASRRCLATHPSDQSSWWERAAWAPQPHSVQEHRPRYSIQDGGSGPCAEMLRLFATPWTAARQASLFITNSRSLLRLRSIKLVMLSNQPCHLSSVVPFSSYLQSFPASGSFPVSHFFASGGQSIRVSASASVLPMNIQD